MTVKAGWEGRFYEDFQAGDIYQHALGRTISEADNTWFTLLTMNTAQPHFNADVAQQHEFGQLLVNSTLTLAIIVGESVADLTQNGIVNLGWDQVRLSAPVFVGDTLYAESRVLAKRESASRPNAGIVTVRTRGLNQKGDIVLTYQRTFMVRRRNAAGQARRFPTAHEPWPDDPSPVSNVEVEE